MKKSVLNYAVDIGLVVTFILSFTTAIIKFPGFLQKIGVDQALFPMYEISVIHDWSGIAMGVLVAAHLVLHWKWLVTMTRTVVTKKVIVTSICVVAGILMIAHFTPPKQLAALEYTIPFTTPEGSNIFGEVYNTAVTLFNSILIDDIGKFEFDPADIDTVRTDIFRDGHFSVFAVLVHLDSQGKIDMEYHFDADMDTHVIDSINKKVNWWYTAHYAGGWPEKNRYRMDYYPYKDNMYIQIHKVSSEMHERIHKTFKEEVERKKDKTVIPLVIIKGVKTDLQIENVEVTAHNLRNDYFQNGVITAIDVVLSLADQGLISYDLYWYDSIGTADIVQSFWVNRINEDESGGRCGFVYEAGSFKYQGFKGNHIHIPADLRAIMSPEYVEFFWICL